MTLEEAKKFVEWGATHGLASLKVTSDGIEVAYRTAYLNPEIDEPENEPDLFYASS